MTDPSKIKPSHTRRSAFVYVRQSTQSQVEHNRESTARQYAPSANKPWEARFPGIFHIKDGTMATETLTGLGLGAVPE